MQKKFMTLNLIAIFLVFIVVTLGAYTRLADAGLGCPDWPGCYGKIIVPSKKADVDKANKAYPERPVEHAKAWKEMIHRAAAGSLGLLILALAIMAIMMRKENRRPLVIALILVPLVVFQAALGMWTVTLKLKPIIVTAHLLMGFLTLTLLGMMYAREKMNRDIVTGGGMLRALVLVCILFVFGQIFLGGWTGSNYAAVTCTEFPTCNNGKWLPDADFKEAFVLWREVGVNYEFGKLKPGARIAIHMTHRFGALLVTLLLLIAGLIILLRNLPGGIKATAGIMLGLLVVQVSLGISVVMMSKPLLLAVAHNGVGVLLLLTTTILYLQLRRNRI